MNIRLVGKLCAGLLALGFTGTSQATLIADFSVNPILAAPTQIVTFDGSISSDDTSWITTWNWDLDFDGVYEITGGDNSVSYSFDAFGMYTVGLQVVNDDGETNTTTKDVQVILGNLAPVADANGPYTINLGDDLLLDASSSYDPNAIWGDSIVEYAWDLDSDGVSDIENSAATFQLSAAEMFSYGLDQVDVPYQIGLEVTDEFGVVGGTSTTLCISCPVQAETVPEPTTLALMALGLVGLRVKHRIRYSQWG